MNDEAQDKLCELLAERGSSLLTLSRTCEMLIAQSCVDYPEEANALIQVEKHGIARELANLSDQPAREKAAESCVQELIDKGNLNDDAARWALAAWMGALKKTSFQPNPSQSWSHANFEAATRTPESLRQKVWAGVQVVFLTVLLLPICLCLLACGAATFRIGLASRLVLPLYGLVLARWMRWLSK
jgi:hypothetical protein